MAWIFARMQIALVMNLNVVEYDVFSGGRVWCALHPKPYTICKYLFKVENVFSTK